MRSDRDQKLRPTAFDLVAAALAPALIIGMVGSLVFFLVIAFYRGAYDVRLMYILGLFTLATVLIARIAIESGRAHANIFAAPLAIVALIAMFRFVTVPGGSEALGWLLNVGLLALVWFLADRITFDCTLLEEDRESVQAGLLQTLGMPERAGAPPKPVAHSAPVVGVKKRAKHNPGVWVLYFALLAFPLFGLGQLAIPSDTERSRAFWLLAIYLGCALGLLTTTSLLALRRYLRQRGVEMPTEITARWLSSGIGLAVAVLSLCMLLPLPGRSLGLIGLPFELRSPDDLASSRFGIGDDGQQSAPHGRPRADQPEDGQAAAGQAQPSESGGAGKQGAPSQSTDASQPQPQAQPGQPGQPSPPARQQPRQPTRGQSPDDESPAPQPDAHQEAQTQPPGKQPDRPASDRPQEQSDPASRPQTTQPQSQNARAREAQAPSDAAQPKPRRPAGQSPAAGRPEPAEAPSNASPSSSVAQQLSAFGSQLGQWFKWLTIAVLAGIVVLYIVTHPGEIVRLWRGWLAFLARLFGAKPRAAAEAGAPAAGKAAAAARPRFAAFANPFAKNLRGWQAAQVVEHTFAALEAWAAEHGHERLSDQTAEEFARRLAASVPQLGKLPVVMAGMLDRVMFAGWQPTAAELAPLAELWRRLESLPFLPQGV